MNGTNHFKNTIQAYLEQRAETDNLFAVAYKKEHKNIDDCITYILNQVQKSGCNGFSDGEIYSLAVHFYDEDNLEVGSSISCNVVVNHTIELTEQEKEEARREAIQRYQNEIYQKQKQSIKPSTKKATPQIELSLF